MSESTIGGGRYVFVQPTDITIEWVTVREHPDTDSGLVLVVPVDSGPSLLGAADIDLTELEGEPLFARCGCSQWVSAERALQWHRCGYLTAESLRLIRQRMHALATGGELPKSAADCDPNYEEHIAEVLSLAEAIGT